MTSPQRPRAAATPTASPEGVTPKKVGDEYWFCPGENWPGGPLVKGRIVSLEPMVIRDTRLDASEGPEGVTAERDDLIKTLIAWLRKRSDPDSGIRYEAASVAFDGTGFRPARAELLGTDADFVAKHFHGRGAAELAAALAAQAQRRDEVMEALRTALEPFAKLDLLTEANGWKEDDYITLLTDDEQGNVRYAKVELLHFRRARAALNTPEPK